MAVKDGGTVPPILRVMIEIEIRLFNSLARYAPSRDARFALRLPDTATVADALRRLQIPRGRIFVLWLNGLNLKEGVGFEAEIESGRPLSSGDILALSGPIPYSTAYGTPVC
ncbi:MAG: hypothetical protein R3298_07940 [Gammaproteobacteria bacterium]|nr:hypothetical protein [Gammaproteobacteria bacterium]